MSYFKFTKSIYVLIQLDHESVRSDRYCSKREVGCEIGFGNKIH